jgi:hypothetical protein
MVLEVPGGRVNQTVLLEVVMEDVVIERSHDIKDGTPQTGGLSGTVSTRAGESWGPV